MCVRFPSGGNRRGSTWSDHMRPPLLLAHTVAFTIARAKWAPKRKRPGPGLWVGQFIDSAQIGTG